jgi:DNA-binding MarR family transcriptional regulator
MKALKAVIDEPATPPAPQGGQELSYGPLPQILGYHLRRTQVAIFRHFSRTVSTEEDITPGLFGMLQVIAANPGLGQSRLAEAMEVDRSTIVKVVDQLEGRGLIIRWPSPNDKRSNCLRLTNEGSMALQRMQTLVLQHEDEFTKALSTDERQVLVRLLMRLYGRTEAGLRGSTSEARSCDRREVGDDIHR